MDTENLLKMTISFDRKCTAGEPEMQEDVVEAGLAARVGGKGGMTGAKLGLCSSSSVPG